MKLWALKIQSAEDMHFESAKSLIIKAKNITEDTETIKLNAVVGLSLAQYLSIYR